MLGMCALEFNDNYPVSKFPLNFFVLSHQLRSQISIQLPTYSFLFSIMYQSTPKWRKKLSLKVRRWYDDFLTNHRSADHCTKTQGVIWPTCVTMSLSVPVSHKCESHGPCSYFWALLCTPVQGYLYFFLCQDFRMVMHLRSEIHRTCIFEGYHSRFNGRESTKEMGIGLNPMGLNRE